MKYHITETGPKVCTARNSKSCPFGAEIMNILGKREDGHSLDKDEAIKTYEKVMEYRHGVLGSFSKTKKSFFKVAENDKIKAISESIDIINSRKNAGKKTLHNTSNKDASIVNNRNVFNTDDYSKVGMKGYLNGDDNEPVEIVKTTFGRYGTIVKYKDKNENIREIMMYNGKADNVITHRD